MPASSAPSGCSAALEQHRFTNISAAATHYRMMRSSGAASRYRYALEKLSFTGEPIDSETAAFVEADVRPAGLQHVRHDRDRRDPGELSGREGFRRQAGLARQADPRRPDRGAGRQRTALRARRHRRAEGLAPRRLDRDQGSRAHRRGRLLLSRRPCRRRHHLRRLDHERGRDRGCDPEASAGARGRGDRRAGCAARPGGEGVRRRRPDRRRAFQHEIQDLVRARLSHHEYPRLVAFVPELPKTPAGKVNRKVLRDRERAI